MTSDASDHLKFWIVSRKPTGILSMIGSFLILRDVHYRRSKQGSSRAIPMTIYIVFELSVADFLSSFFYPFMGTWMVPRESGAYMARGNTASCTTQGFFSALFYSMSVWSNASLAVAYCLIVKTGWKDNPAKYGPLHYFLLLFPALIGLVSAVIPLFDQAYNYNGRTSCATSPYPHDCLSPYSDQPCLRGSKSKQLKYAASMTVVIANFIIIAAVLLLVHSVFNLEKRMDRYGSPGNRSNTTKATKQGLCYIAAFAVAWWPWYVLTALQQFSDDVIPTPIYALYSLFFPTQGLWNAMAYFRPRYKSDRASHRDDSRIDSILRVLRLSFPKIPLIPTPLKNRNNAKPNLEMAVTEGESTNDVIDTPDINHLTESPQEIDPKHSTRKEMLTEKISSLESIPV